MSEDRDPLEKIRARMLRPREKPVHASIKSAFKQASVVGGGGSGRGSYGTKGGWASISSGAATRPGGQYSRRVVVKVRYVNFSNSPQAAGGGFSSGAAGGKRGYGTAFDSTFSHLGYAQDRPLQAKGKASEKEQEKERGQLENAQQPDERKVSPHDKGAEVSEQDKRWSSASDHGQLYGESGEINPHNFAKQCENDKRQFRLIISPEDGAEVDLTKFTKQLVKQMEKDLGTKLDWAAANHYNTDNPHSHLIIRGNRQNGDDLVIHPKYIQEGIRHRAIEILDRELGLRTDHEIRQEMTKEISAERVTGLDRLIHYKATGIDKREVDISNFKMRDPYQSRAVTSRVMALRDMGLAYEKDNGQFLLKDGWMKTLKALGERHDIYKQMSAHGYPNVVMIDGVAPLTSPVLGKVVKVGYYDELYERKFALLNGTDGKVHYVKLDKLGKDADVSVGSLLKVNAAGPNSFLMKSDHNIAEFSKEHPGDTLTKEKFALWSSRVKHIRPDILDSYVEAHMLRLGHLAAKGFVEDKGDGYSVPENLVTEIKKFDEHNFKTAGVKLSIKQVDQVRFDRTIEAVGVTQLDKHILGLADYQMAKTGFGSELNGAVKLRQQYLVQQGLGRFDKGTFIPADKLLDRLRINHVKSQVFKVPGVTQSAKLDLTTERFVGNVAGEVKTDTGRFLVVMSDDKSKLAISRLGQNESFSVGAKVDITNNTKGQGLSLPARSKIIELVKGLGQ